MSLFCRKCGTEAPDGSVACPKCGSQNLVNPGGGPANNSPQPVQQSTPAPMPGPVMAPRTGPVITGGRPDAPYGRMKTASQDAANPNMKWYMIGGAGLVVIIIVAVLMIPRITKHPLFFNAKDPKYSQTCMEHQHYLSVVFDMYSEDHNEMYPPNNGDWAKAIDMYVGKDPADQVAYDCPLSKKVGTVNDPDYAVNAELLGTSYQTLGRPAATLLLSDDAGSTHLLKSTADIATTTHKLVDKQNAKSEEGVIVTFLDGHGEMLPNPSTAKLAIDRVPAPPDNSMETRLKEYDAQQKAMQQAQPQTAH